MNDDKKTRENTESEIQVITNVYAVKPVYNDSPWDPKFVAFVDRWLLFRGSFM